MYRKLFAFSLFIINLCLFGCGGGGGDGDSTTPQTATKLEVTTPPTNTTYKTTDSALNLTGIVVTATMSDGTKKTVTDFKTSTPDFTTAGAKTVTLTYGVLTTSFGITVMAKPTSGSGLAGGGASPSDTSWITTKFTNVAYATTSSAQVMDIFLPNTGTGPFPLIISIHGGAFKSGDKADGQEAPMIGTATAGGIASGYAVASINYRLSAAAVFPAAINDVKAAIRFLRANSAKYKLDPNKFAAWGGSSGGNLSSLAAVSGGVATLADESLGNAGVSDAIQASVDWFGPIYFSTMDSEFAALGQTPVVGETSSAGSAESVYLGQPVGTAEAEPLVIAASPQTYISADDPPFFIQHGTADRNIPITQSINFSNKLSAALGAGKVTYETLEGAGHGGSQFTATTNVARIIAFLDKYLK